MLKMEKASMFIFNEQKLMPNILMGNFKDEIL